MIADRPTLGIPGRRGEEGRELDRARACLAGVVTVPCASRFRPSPELTTDTHPGA